MNLETPRLTLRLQTPAEVLAWVDSLSPEVRAEISPVWLQRLHASTGPDPWSCMFSIIAKESNLAVGSCGFKAPPDQQGAVEIAYGIEEAFQRQGFANEAAAALLEFARNTAGVTTVRAHTKAQNGASERVLQKLGFAFVGVVEDPEDGAVNRWEIAVARVKARAHSTDK